MSDRRGPRRGTDWSLVLRVALATLVIAGVPIAAFVKWLISG